MRKIVLGFAHIAICCICAVAAYIYMATPKEGGARKVQTYQMPAIPDIKQPPTHEDYNRLLHALRQSRIMKEPDPSAPPPASDWLYWWPFTGAKPKNTAP